MIFIIYFLCYLLQSEGNGASTLGERREMLENNKKRHLLFKGGVFV
jgi:hypothetical protein